MKNFHKRLFLFVIMLLNLYFSHANKYVVSYVNNRGKIYINDKKVHVGMVFDDKKDIIRWISNNQSFRARPLEGTKKQDKVFTSQKATSKSLTFWDYLQGLYVNLGTKGLDDEMALPLLLLDSVTIDLERPVKDTHFEIQWYSNNHISSYQLPLSKQSDKIFITRKLFNKLPPQIYNIEIWATDELGTYRYKSLKLELLIN